jgi:hypothetical protein
MAMPAVAGYAPRHLTVPALPGSYLTLLSNIALNASAATRTFTVSKDNIHGMAKVVLTVKRTRVAGTDLTMTCTQSPDSGATKGTVQVCEYEAGTGTCTHYTNTWRSGTSTTETLTWEIGVLGYGQLDCTFVSTSAGATDLLTVLGVLVTQ